MKTKSRKSKASWRKNVNITDVEEYLESQREDERIGTIADKPDAALFTKDVTRSDNRKLLKAQRRKKFTAKPMFCNALENHSKVSDPIAKRNLITNEQRIASIKKKREDIISRKTKVSAKNAQKKARSTDQFAMDIWEEDPVPEELQNEWISESVVLHNMKNTGKPLVKVAASTHAKPNVVPNVELPSAGTSYNPSIDDYNELKEQVIEKERVIIKKAEHLDRVVTQKFTKLSKEDRDRIIHEEMTEGLFQTEGVDEPVEYDDVDEYKSVNPPVKNKKKDRKALNKKFRAVAKKNAEVELKVELKKLRDINRVHEYQCLLDKHEAKSEKLQKNRAKRQEEKKKTAGRVAYLKFEEAEIDFAEPSELADSLRTVVPNKSLLADRFKSFQRRTLIAPKKHRDGIPRNNRSTLKKWKRYELSTHKIV
ncbi:ribosome biogenesis protein NOP53 [Uranotaenia lowii]|uniref:ribosome biogenesis protein NOP53 n=1 Tax=Uranotaenia lowii TaxID=190385 RepID=UPI00247AED15|nr:ribosome biogenesis protein NOP53 [Uranotaenia lowii]